MIITPMILTGLIDYYSQDTHKCTQAHFLRDFDQVAFIDESKEPEYASPSKFSNRLIHYNLPDPELGSKTPDTKRIECFLTVQPIKGPSTNEDSTVEC